MGPIWKAKGNLLHSYIINGIHGLTEKIAKLRPTLHAVAVQKIMRNDYNLECEKRTEKCEHEDI